MPGELPSLLQVRIRSTIVSHTTQPTGYIGTSSHTYSRRRRQTRYNALSLGSPLAYNVEREQSGDAAVEDKLSACLPNGMFRQL